MDRDPVCGKKMNRNNAHVTIEYKGERYYLCCPFKVHSLSYPGYILVKFMN